MKELKLFKSPIFGQVRTIVVNAQVLFAATDVAKCLGYANPKDAVIRHCKSDGVVFCDLIDTMGRNQKAKFITKGNVIRLVASSELPKDRIYYGYNLHSHKNQQWTNHSAADGKERR